MRAVSTTIELRGALCEADVSSDDPEAVDGAPGSVQVVGWRFQDEEVLMATEVIANALQT